MRRRWHIIRRIEGVGNGMITNALRCRIEQRCRDIIYFETTHARCRHRAIAQRCRTRQSY